MSTWTSFESPPEYAQGTTSPTQQANEHLKAPTNTSAHITSSGSLQSAPLEHYILLAEHRHLPERARRRLFRPAPNVAPPTLRSDCENRVLVFPGAFNPPHHGHTRLLWHVYLALDDKSIAVMILPMGDESVCRKKLTKAASRRDDRVFALDSDQRRELWRDDVLSRFVWVWPADTPDGCSAFLRCIQNVAEEDGFRVSFPSLHGGDHFRSFRSKGSIGWGTGSIVTNDVGRAVDFVKGQYEDVRLPRCGKWKTMRSAVGGHTGTQTCKECWPCRKLRAVCPEFFDAGVATRTTSGDLDKILQRCHDSHDRIWWAKMRCAQGSRSSYLVFVPGDRTYEQEASKAAARTQVFRELKAPLQRPSLTVSSTMVRRLFFCHESREDLKDCLRSLVINPELLATYLGIED